MRLLWLDLETTGLDPSKDKPLAVGVGVTNHRDLILTNEREWFVKYELPELTRLDAYTLPMHIKSGVLEKCVLKGTDRPTVDRELAQYIRDNFGAVKPHMAGNSIHFDKEFLRSWFPESFARIHHRMLDVSSLRLLGLMWDLPAHNAPEPEHTPLSDIRGSIAELAHWRARFAGES